jgi:hypothetical protein
MTQDEIISLARQAGVWTEEDDWFKDTKFEYSWKLRIEAFAKLVAEKEREACAKWLEDKVDAPNWAKQIRARGEDT